MSDTYIVFSVDAADRFTLLLPPKPGECAEFKAAMLSYITAPKLARRTAEGTWSVEEPCAFDAMDFVRSQIIGKQVQFKDEFAVEPLQRVSGRLTLPDNSDLARTLLKKGLATISERPPPKMERKLHEEYILLQDQAKAAKCGVWAPDAHLRVRQLKPFPPEDRNVIDRNIKGKTLKARVERVQSGSVITIMLLDYHQQLIVHFTGVQSPSPNKTDGTPDPIGSEAKFHTERSLLHRHVPMTFDGLDKFGNFLVTIGSARGTFQEELLTRGYAVYNDVTGALATPELREKYRQLESAAKQQKVGIHAFSVAVTANAVGSTPSDPAGSKTSASSGVQVAEKGPRRDYNGARDFDGTVVQIIAGDTVVIRTLTAQYIRVALAGVKCAKPKRTEHDKNNAGGEPRTTFEDYAWEAREFLRTKYIGKSVSVHVEFGRHYEDTKEVRPVATVVTDDGTNIGAAVVGQGFATVQIGFNDTISSASDLLAAEEAAKTKQIGLHSGQPSSSVSVHELNRLGASKGKYYLTFLQRGMVGNKPPKHNGIVDMVMSGSSFRVYVPKEHFQFTLKLGGVITPATAIGDDPADPFAQEAKDFAITHLQQREVQLQVETCDRGGNFIGAIFVNGNNFAEMITAAGLATVAAADRLPYGTELQRAQKSAQEAHLFIWSSSGAIPARQQKRNQMALLANPDAFIPVSHPESFPVVITDVASGSSVWLQPQTEEGNAAYEQIAAALESLADGAPHPNPNRGENLAAYYKPDKTWLRAKVLAIDKDEGSAEVQYTDYGTREWVELKHLRQLPKNDETFRCVRETAPLAFQANVAFLQQMPDTHEFNDAACNLIWEFSEKEGLVAHSEFTDGAKRKFFGVKAADGSDLTLTLLREGLGLTERRCDKVDAAGVKLCLEAQEEARKKHRQMWRFGDIEGEDEN